MQGAAGRRVSLKARHRGRVVARGSGRTDSAGRAQVRLRFKPAARRALARKRRVALSIAGGGATKRVTLRR